MTTQFTQERRSTHRPRMLKSGGISGDGATTMVDCVIRNMNAEGAKVKIFPEAPVPQEFQFYDKSNASRISAHKVWRRGDEMGIEFKQG